MDKIVKGSCVRKTVYILRHAVVFSRPHIRHDHDHIPGLPLRHQISDDILRGSLQPFSVITTDAMKKIKHRIDLFVIVFCRQKNTRLPRGLCGCGIIKNGLHLPVFSSLYRLVKTIRYRVHWVNFVHLIYLLTLKGTDPVTDAQIFTDLAAPVLLLFGDGRRHGRHRHAGHIPFYISCKF